MKVLLLDHDYDEFQRWLYTRHPGLADASYATQVAARNESLFGVADFYSRNLRALGHEAVDIQTNNPWMQAAWAREHGSVVDPGPPPPAADAPRSSPLRAVAKRLVPAGLHPWVGRLAHGAATRRHLAIDAIVERQIADYRPDIFFNFQMESTSVDALRRIRPHVGAIVGQRDGLPVPADLDTEPYDFVISSFPATVDDLRQRGVACALHRFGFEHTLLERVPTRAPQFDAVFVGTLGEADSPRVRFLEAVAASTPELLIWAPTIDHLPASSPLHARYRGQAWGRTMYGIFRAARVVVNQHGETDLPHANNMRLFEATGIGACLLTDDKPDLHAMFEPGREVATYRDAPDAAERIRHYLAHPDERAAIARAGQRRTLTEHTYAHRARELVEILTPLVSGHGAKG